MGKGSSQCLGAWLRKLSQSHVCHILLVKAVTELPPPRIRADGRGDALWKKWQRLCSRICSAWSMTEGSRESGQGKRSAPGSDGVVCRAAWALIRNPVQPALTHLFIWSVSRKLLCVLSGSGSVLYLRNGIETPWRNPVLSLLQWLGLCKSRSLPSELLN